MSGWYIQRFQKLKLESGTPNNVGIMHRTWRNEAFVSKKCLIYDVCKSVENLYFECVVIFKSAAGLGDSEQ